MDITGEYLIPADRRTVWQAINDPEVLRECIPGCDSLTPAEDGLGYDATVTAKVGPVKATFRGSVRLEDIVEPESYRIVGEGKGGAAGFAKGGANVVLEEVDAGNTRLTYKADAQVGGKLAQLGSRLIQGTAKKYADDFFARLTARLSPQDVPDTAATVGMGVASTDAGRPREGEAQEGGTPPAAAPVTPPPQGEAMPAEALAAGAPPQRDPGAAAGPTAAERAGAQAAAATPERPIPAEAAAATTAGRAEAPAKASGGWMWWAAGAVVIAVLVLLFAGG